MTHKVVPMIHVADVGAAVDWYTQIGFKVLATYGDDGEGPGFAMLSFGSSQVMFNGGGRPSKHHRREVDLYVYTDNVDDLYELHKDRVEVVEPPHDSFYGMRELIVRDPNGFWVTFGQPSAFESLITGVREGDVDSARAALDRSAVKPETLTAALLTATAGGHAEIVEMLKAAGAVPPPEVDAAILRSYVGRYKNEAGIEIEVILKDGKLFGALGSDEPLTLMALDQLTFRPVTFDGHGSITFQVESGKTTGCAFQYGEDTMQLERVDETQG